MILFTKENAKLIVDGKKIQTRRYWKTQRMNPGNYYYCQTSLKPATRFARILCLDIWEWDGKTISERDAIEEGFTDAVSFLSKYNDLNEPKLDDDDRKHYAIKFRVSETYTDDSIITYWVQNYSVSSDDQLTFWGDVPDSKKL